MTHPQQPLSFREAFETEYTYVNGFLRNVARYADKVALTDVQTKQNWTYDELNRLVNRYAHALADDGLEKGNTVMYMSRNSPLFAFSYLAPQKIGAIGCPVNYYQTAYELALTIDETEPDVFVYESVFRDTVETALSRVTKMPRRIVMAVTAEDEAAELPEGHILFEDYIEGKREDEPVPSEPLNMYDPTTRFYTSGTTSRPNSVIMRSINEILSAHDVIMGFSMLPSDRTMNLTPWFHRGGLHSGGPCPTFYIGGTCVMYREGASNYCLKTIDEFKVTFAIGVPSVFNLLCRFEERSRIDLSSLRGIVTMGSPLDRTLCIRIKDILCPNVFNGYGTTETFWNTFLRPGDLPEMAGSAGQSCIDDDVRLVRNYNEERAEPDDLAEKDNTEVGEIIISSIAKIDVKYQNNPERTEKKYYKGFLYTGDLGTWDENGFFTICGRKDDMIVTAGENIHAVQVEGIINEHPKVFESCVVGVPDELRGQIVAAYVVPSDESLTIEELRDFLYNHPMLAEFKRPRYYALIDALPHTPTGKLQHNKVRDKAPEDVKNGVLKRSN
ncbi:MAG: acyl--CoA ligase [Eggerthellaceae bacterium]|nr:acyl--CoA ligase [Eggerthellaceae bacterium]